MSERINGVFQLTGGTMPTLRKGLPVTVKIRAWLIKKIASGQPFLVNGYGHIDASGVHISHQDQAVYTDCTFYQFDGGVFFYETEKDAR